MSNTESTGKVEREPVNRSHKIAWTALGVTIFFGILSVLGWHIISPKESAPVNNIACYQLCGLSAPASAEPKPAANDQIGCVSDPNDASQDGGWGPARNILPQDKYSEFPSFNLDNEPTVIGDERNFYGVRENGTPPPNLWHHLINVERGKTYVVRIYVHNSASENLTATGTRLNIRLPSCQGHRISSYAFVTADNTEPKTMYDGVVFRSKENFNLSYVAGSAVLCNRHFSCNPAEGSGAPLSNDMFTSTGVLLGYDSLDGSIPGGYKYDSFIAYIVKPQFAGD